ncbi:hypothetical protein XAP3CFBP6996_008780 [Xanthomonas citri pv. fuscans CFBP 6996]|uniref:hypothetical protein n=1 Tax=Xanthomonas citri TaxID=346 RepID=UPI000C1980F4|nr:hypothetical protein [Xanthomonas citri]PTY31995.1 hypothetical protein XAP3CFBP6996_008780 [Xanthomonas citri pv. fuscans CFBP 6996]QWN15944.1 hypothetical protein DGN02_08865 [Xanthomonas citri]
MKISLSMMVRRWLRRLRQWTQLQCANRTHHPVSVNTADRDRLETEQGLHALALYTLWRWSTGHR